MDYAVKISAHTSKEAKVIVNEKLSEKINLSRKKRGIISFGTQKCLVDICLSKKIEENEILISQKVIDDLHIPLYPTFEIKTKGNEIIIGPCIGILASSKYEDITKRRLKEIYMNTMAYSRIHGAIIVFSLDKVDTMKRLIEGYCYNPKEDRWETGIFPYPLSIYRRSLMNEKWMNHFISAIGDTIFSNYSFDKWEMHNWFLNEPDISPYIPSTRIYESKNDITEMLEKFGVVYIKPIWGMKGFGVIRVSYNDGKTNFKYREDDENRDITANDSEEFDNIIKKLFEPGNHIIQQGLDLFKYDGGIVDFRCVMQKNITFKWVCNTIIGRVGASDSVVSNISSGGAALPGMDLIRNGLTVTESEMFILKEKITSLCTKVCRALDDYGFNFGTLGLDIGIDNDKNIWLIEVNNRKPHPGVAIRANDIPAYYTILSAPLYYAKALSGFGCKEESNDVL